MWTCENCNKKLKTPKDVYHCWRFHLTLRVMEDHGLRDGAIICKSCYDFFSDRILDPFRKQDTIFIKEEEMILK